MTQIQDQLKKALHGQGFYKTQMQRVWEWLKDHPGKTAKDLTAEFKLKSVTSLLAQMGHRKMLTMELRPYHKTGRNVGHYYVASNMQAYELLPLVKPKKQVVEQLQEDPQPAASQDTEIDIENMTLSEARKLYMRLHSYFGKQNA